MKLGNFFAGNVFTISQSPHGSVQNGKAIDAVPVSGTRVIAPCDMEIYYRKNDLGHQSYSYARGDGWKMVFVHCSIEKQGHVKKGTDIGYLHTGGPVHLHVAIEVNGVWDVVLNYMDRSIQLALTAGFSSQHWKSWTTWKDLNLGQNNMANFVIPSQDYEYAKQYIPTFVQKYGGELNGMDQYIWFFKHGAQRTNELLAERDSEINKLNGALGGMTTDRNKYLNLSDEIKKKLDGEIAEVNRLNLELEGVQKELKIVSSKLLLSDQELNNCTPAKEELQKEVAQLKGANQSLVAINKMLEKKIRESENNKKGITVAELFEKILNAIRNLFSKRR